MRPNISDYNLKDLRQIILYSWSFDLLALKYSIELTNTQFSNKISHLLSEADVANENEEWEIHCNLLNELQTCNSIDFFMYQSILLSMYSILEACLDKYCEICANQFHLPIKLVDLKDKGIFRAINYLEKVVEIEKVKSGHIWKKINIINKLRNDIIHRAGIIVNEDKINEYAYELKVEVIDNRICITYENLVEIYDYIDKFINYVFSRECLNENRSFLIK